jgi:hypothetical protein
MDAKQNSLSSVTQPQVRVLFLNGLETQLYVKYLVTYFAEQCCRAIIRQSTASGVCTYPVH